MATKALADISSEQTSVAIGDLFFVESAGTPAKITYGNLFGGLAGVNVTIAGAALLDDADAAAQRTTLGLAEGALAPKASTAEAEAGTDDSKYMTPLKTKEAVDTFSPAVLVPGFESAEITLVGGTNLSVAHGLGRRPHIIKTWLRCIVANGGYAVGDEVLYTPNERSNQYGFNLLIESGNTTEMQLVFAEPPVLINKATNTSFILAANSWRLIIKAW